MLQDLRPASGTVSAPTTADSLFDEADTADTACGRLTPSELRRTELMQTIDALCRRYSCNIEDSKLQPRRRMGNAPRELVALLYNPNR